jgi:cell wall-associated NlpC family hydrolase
MKLYAIKHSLSLKRLTLHIIAAVFLVSVHADYAAALTEADYIPQGINYYGNEVACKAASGSLVSGNSEKEKIWNYLVGKGLTSEQAAGVMGNMKKESQLVPTSHQNASGNVWHSDYSFAWGLAQWDGGRRFTSPDKGILGKLRAEKPNLVKYASIEYDYIRNPAAKAKIPEDDLNALITFELDYLFQESQVRPVTAAGFGNAGNEWGTLRLQKTVEDATVFWHNNFEVSKDSKATVLADRGGAATEYYTEFAGKGSTATTTSTSSSACAGTADTSSITTTIKAYAWPEYHAPDYLTMKPEYKTAILAAQKKGEYVGGGINPGIDCGGFVMRVLRDSKFEPEYNSTCGPVATSQVPWVKANGWKKLGTGSTINVADLKPGDVVFYNWSGNPNTDNFDHTAIFAGKIDGFAESTKDYKGIASASYGGETQGTGAWRTPMAGVEDPTFAGAVWYRKG